MKPLPPSAAVVVLLALAFDVNAQSTTLDTSDPWDGKRPNPPLDVIDPWDDSKPPLVDPKKEIVPPWPKARRRPVRELNLVDPWTEYPKRRRPIPRRELSVVDPWADDAPEIPTAAFPLVADTAPPIAPPKPSPPPAEKRIPTARFPLLSE